MIALLAVMLLAVVTKQTLAAEAQRRARYEDWYRKWLASRQ